MTTPSSVLFANEARTVVVVDLPRSIEEVQGGDRKRRLVSSPPPETPFPAPPEPRHPLAAPLTTTASLAAQLADLSTQAAVEAALAALQQEGFRGPWCRPRVVGRKGPDADVDGHVHIPPGARYLHSSIAAGRDRFLAEAPPGFDVVVLDPPWPNRSARRRRRRRPPGDDTTCDTTYDTARDMDDMRALLAAVPVGARLAPAGLVAVWVTNKPACTALLTDPRRGLFRAWDVDLVATWAWLKVTARGAPVVPPASTWRKPWERLLLARRRGSSNSHVPPAIPDTVVVGVPDVHSRKPHLRALLAPYLVARPGEADADAVGLEVFARNLTAGWWAWGDEVLLFQGSSLVQEDGQDGICMDHLD